MNAKPTKLLLLVLLATAAAVTAGRLPLAVSFEDLVNHPERYNGKRVSVRAYLVTSCAHCQDLWASVQAARDSRVHASSVEKWILMGDFIRESAVPKGFLDSVKSQTYDGYVRVTGTFRYVYVSPETGSPKGFGWDRLGDKEITDITHLQSLGPPIPAQID